jgi:hypothetical protein
MLKEFKRLITALIIMLACGLGAPLLRTHQEKIRVIMESHVLVQIGVIVLTYEILRRSVPKMYKWIVTPIVPDRVSVKVRELYVPRTAIDKTQVMMAYMNNSEEATSPEFGMLDYCERQAASIASEFKSMFPAERLSETSLPFIKNQLSRLVLGKKSPKPFQAPTRKENEEPEQHVARILAARELFDREFPYTDVRYSELHKIIALAEFLAGQYSETEILINQMRQTKQAVSNWQDGSANYGYEGKNATRKYRPLPAK